MPIPLEKGLFGAISKALHTETSGFPYLSFLALCRTFDTIATFDHIGLEADGSRTAVQLEEEAASIAEDRANFIPPPQRCRRCLAILAYGLQIDIVMISKGCHDFDRHDERGLAER